MHLLKNEKTEGNEQIIHLLIKPLKLCFKEKRTHIMFVTFQIPQSNTNINAILLISLCINVNKPHKFNIHLNLLFTVDLDIIMIIASFLIDFLTLD